MENKPKNPGVGMMKFGGSMILMGCSLMILIPIILVVLFLIFF